MPDAFKIRENLLRRMAKRQGLELRKSRRRDPRALDYGQYELVDPKTNTAVSFPFASLDEVERALTED